MRVLMIDNIDSFTFNLVQALRCLGAEVDVHRNDAITVEQAESLAPTHLVVSPGPGRPEEAGASQDVIRAFLHHVPILGVCLGHQCLAAVLGGQIVRAPKLRHGKSSPIYHDAQGILRGLPRPFIGGRYHSLVVDPQAVPDCLEVTAQTSEGDIMAIQHRDRPAVGVQFHPESVLTPRGEVVLANFLAMEAA